MMELIGFTAATLTTAAFVPQAWQVYKTRRTRDLSLALFVMLNAGVALWLVYGLMLGAMPIIVANAISLVLMAYILSVKLREQSQSDDPLAD